MTLRLKRAMVRFVCCLPAAMVASLFLVATQAMSGTETIGSLLLTFGGSWWFIFGIAAAIPSLGSGFRSLALTFVSYGMGGALTGALIALLLVTHHLGGSAAKVWLALAIPFTIPWIAGTVILWVLTSDEPPAAQS